MPGIIPPFVVLVNVCDMLEFADLISVVGILVFALDQSFR